jgi:hypothetical protein
LGHMYNKLEHPSASLTQSSHEPFNSPVHWSEKLIDRWNTGWFAARPKKNGNTPETLQFLFVGFPRCTLRCVIASPFQVSGRKICVHCQCWILLQFLICLFTQKNRHTPPNNSHQGSCVWHLFFVDKFSWSPDV